MSKQQAVANPAGEKLPAKISADGTEVINADEMMALVNKGEVGEVLTSNFLTMEPGEEKRVVIYGMTEVPAFNGQAGMNEAVRLVHTNDETGEVEQSTMANSVIVSFAKSHLKELPIPVLLVCKGKVTGKKGMDYFDFEIRSILISAKK